MSKPELKTECERCGTCCMKGGPALHLEDKKMNMKNTDYEFLTTFYDKEELKIKMP